MKVRFTIPGVPQGKERARVDGRSGRIFTAKKTVQYERLVLQLWKLAAPRFTPHIGPVVLRFTAVFPIPPSWPKAAREAAARGLMYHVGTPDKDNIEKAILDGLNPPPGDRKLGLPSNPSGHPWHNDGQVMGGGIKRYGSPPRLDVELEFVDQPGGIMTPGEARTEAKVVEALSGSRMRSLQRKRAAR